MIAKPSFLIAAFAVAILVSATGISDAADAKAKAKAKRDPAFDAMTDDPKLPRVLLVGDSISIGYTVPVRNLLKDKANVHRIAENGGPTTNGLGKLQKWVAVGKWDVIHFNWGLHDLKFMDDGTRQVPIDAYEKNLRELVKQLKATGAKLIWCSTTPVPDAKMNPPRRNEDVIAYNVVAKKIMDENSIAIDDLYSYTLPKLADVQRLANVHYTDPGYEFLAKQVADSIQAALPKR